MLLSKLKSLSLYRMLFSVLFSVINLFIFYIQHSNVHYLVFVANMPILTAIVYFLTGKLLQYCRKESHIYSDITENISAKQYFWRVSLILFVSWLPIFLAYYPGLFAYDIHGQLPQNIGTYNSHQPVFHTLFMQFFYYTIGEKLFSDYNIGIACSSITQMLLFSMMLSFGHLYLYQCKVRKVIRYIIIGMTALLPQFSMLAISTTKDTLFSGFVIVFVTCILFEQNFPQTAKRKIIFVLYIISGVGIIVFRNNGIFPIAGVLLFALYRMIVKKEKKFFCKILIIIVSALILKNGLTVVLQVKNGSKNEMLNVPYQQIAGVYYNNNENLTVEEKAYIEQLFPTLHRYKPELSDYVKDFGTAEKNMKDFVSMYFQLGIKYPYTYLKAFCQLNAGYLSLTDITYSEIYTKYARLGVLLSDTKEGFGIHHYSLIPPIENVYESLYTDNYYLYVIGLNILLSPSLYFWIIIFLFTVAAMKKNKKSIPLLIFIGILMLTMLFGPCVLVRYALAFEVCLPLLFVTIFGKSEKTEENKNDIL